MKLVDEISSEIQMSLKDMELEQLMWRPSPASNSMGWLAWHIARMQDARAAALAGGEQLWISDGWHERFGLSADPTNHGRGHTDEQVDAVRPDSAAALAEYCAAAGNYLREQLENVEDTDSTDPVAGDSGDANIGALVMRVVHGGLAHTGQLMYVRGLVEKRHWFPR